MVRRHTGGIIRETVVDQAIDMLLLFLAESLALIRPWLRCISLHHNSLPLRYFDGAWDPRPRMFPGFNAGIDAYAVRTDRFVWVRNV